MTNNIEKLYKLAKVEKLNKVSIHLNKAYNFEFHETDTKSDFYSPFTDTKQLELIKWSAFEKRFSMKYINAKWYFSTGEMGMSTSAKYEPFEQLLAYFICNLWQDLTDEQREEVRGILR